MKKKTRITTKKQTSWLLIAALSMAFALVLSSPMLFEHPPTWSIISSYILQLSIAIYGGYAVKKMLTTTKSGIVAGIIITTVGTTVGGMVITFATPANVLAGNPWIDPQFYIYFIYTACLGGIFGFIGTWFVKRS